MGMTKLRLLLLMFPLILSAAVLCGLGGQEKSETPQTIRATGRVRLVGSGPGMELVITGANREWHMDKKDQDKFRNLQQQTVTVEGEESVEEITFSNGRSAGKRYMLRNIKIIDPSEH
jgi:hypothetical protein